MIAIDPRCRVQKSAGLAQAGLAARLCSLQQGAGGQAARASAVGRGPWAVGHGMGLGWAWDGHGWAWMMGMGSNGASARGLGGGR